MNSFHYYSYTLTVYLRIHSKDSNSYIRIIIEPFPFHATAAIAYPSIPSPSPKRALALLRRVIRLRKVLETKTTFQTYYIQLQLKNNYF